MYKVSCVNVVLCIAKEGWWDFNHFNGTISENV